MKEIQEKIADIQSRFSDALGEHVMVSVYADRVAVSGYVAGRYESAFGDTPDEAFEKFKEMHSQANPGAAELRRRAADLIAEAELLEAGR